MAELKLDQLIKGIPPSNVSSQDVAIAATPGSTPSERAIELIESKKPSSALSPTDPLSTLPSSPPQIYLNLLILEASLRSQYLALYARRGQYTFFLALLGLWEAWFFYAVFLRVREDGKGLGGSVYWVVDMGEKVAFMGGLLTAVLIWATGQWERGLRWPRRWVGTTNRGLRGMNMKIVILRGPWWRQPFAYVTYFFPYLPFFASKWSSYCFVESTEKQMSTNSRHGYREGSHVTTMREEDVAPGGDRIRLLLLPKAFSPEFRENWDTYRTSYWEKENERRAELRKSIKQKAREEAKKHAGWLWWTGWGGFGRARRSLHANVADPEKVALGHRTRSSKEVKRERPKSIPHGSASKTSSRSGTPSMPEGEDGVTGLERRRLSKTSSTTGTSTRSAKSPSRRALMDDQRTGSSDSISYASRRSTLSSADSFSTDADAANKPARVTRSQGDSKLLPSVRTRQRDLPSDSGED